MLVTSGNSGSADGKPNALNASDSIAFRASLVGGDEGRCCMIQSRCESGRFPTPLSRHHSVGLRPAELGHPVEDVTPDHDLSRLRVAVPRLQAVSE